MDQPKAPSMQDAIRRQQQLAFTGHGAELEAFREQPALAGDDPRRRYVLNVFGQGGVGKTTLLREYVRLARGRGLRRGCDARVLGGWCTEQVP